MILFEALALLFWLAIYAICTVCALATFAISSMTFFDCMDDTPDRSYRLTFIKWLDDVDLHFRTYDNRRVVVPLISVFFLFLDAATIWIGMKYSYSAVDFPRSIALLICAHVWFFWIPCCRWVRAHFRPSAPGREAIELL